MEHHHYHAWAADSMSGSAGVQRSGATCPKPPFAPSVPCCFRTNEKQLLYNICSVPIVSYFCSWKASGITLLPSHIQTKRVYHKKEPLLKSVRFTFAPSLKILISSSPIKFQLIQFHLIIEFLLLPDLRSTTLSK